MIMIMIMMKTMMVMMMMMKMMKCLAWKLEKRLNPSQVKRSS